MIAELMDEQPFEQEREQALRIGIVRAREKGPADGHFVAGDAVVVDGIAAQLKVREIRGEEAVVWVEGDESTVRTVAYEDLIDMAVLIDETVKALKESQRGSKKQIKH